MLNSAQPSTTKSSSLKIVSLIGPNMGSTSTATLESILPEQERSFHSLYLQGEGDGAINITFVIVMPTSTLQMTSNLPLPSRYPYQHLASGMDSRTLARMFLQLVGQMVGMMSGKMPLVFFDLDDDNVGDGDNTLEPKGEQERRHRADAARNFLSLSPQDRPEVTFVARPEDIRIPDGGRIAVFNPMDFLVHLLHVVDPDVHYDLLSKRSLALSNLPTPPSEVIDTVLEPVRAQDADAVALESARMLHPVRERLLPFVAKLPQALSATGTFLVRSEAERQAALLALGPEVRRMLSATTPANAHLRPASLILQELVPGPCVGLSLFVARGGRVEFLSCTEQVFDPASNLWAGGRIAYAEQDRLQRAYADTAATLASYLHERGYYGPVGIDVLTDARGRQVIVDMNVRITGTMNLGIWRHHFVGQGLLHAATFFPMVLALDRDGFERRFGREIREGRIVILGWSHGEEKGESSAAVVMMGSETVEGLEDLIGTVGSYRPTN
ncbi:hypothetical protein PG993_014151 [Apiospora rasikravindrae]|uniref:ATP-grasp domain-containing protein n=1 Tax=Apiospora rasikravindrae TaxID=990691 RepID=A0ABR1RTS8_9PEZI